MTVSVTSTGHALSDRLQQIAVDRIGRTLAPVGSGHAEVVLAWPMQPGPIHAHVTVALAGRTVEVDGAAAAAEYALVNAVLALRQRVIGMAVPRVRALSGVALPSRPSPIRRVS